MKKIVSLFLLSVFLLSVPGLAYSLHFCGDMLISATATSAQPKKSCVCDKAQDSEDCCKEQQVKLSVDESKQALVDYKLNVPKFVLLSAVVPELFLQLLAPSFQYLSFSDHPNQSILKVPVYLFIGSFRI